MFLVKSGEGVFVVSLLGLGVNGNRKGRRGYREDRVVFWRVG